MSTHADHWQGGHAARDFQESIRWARRQSGVDLKEEDMTMRSRKGFRSRFPVLRRGLHHAAGLTARRRVPSLATVSTVLTATALVLLACWCAGHSLSGTAFAS